MATDKNKTENDKAFKMLSDEEAKEQGLPTEPTADDIAEGERARAGHFPQAPQPAPSPLVETPPKTWDELSPSTRAEMEAGRTLTGGGLSAKEAYERSLRPVPPVASLPTPEATEVAAEPSEATKAEMEAGRQLLARDKTESDRVAQQVAESKAKNVETGAPADPRNDLSYTAPKE